MMCAGSPAQSTSTCSAGLRLDEDRRYNAQKMDEQFYSTLNHDSEMQPQNEEVQPENNGLSDSDMELLSLLKSLTPEMKEMLLKQSASK